MNRVHSQQTPPWANARKIFRLYIEAAELRAKGHDVEVDHIIPLRGALVSGLHVENNLRIISRTENGKKSNTPLFDGQPTVLEERQLELAL